MTSESRQASPAAPWSADALQQLHSMRELLISASRANGTHTRPTPIWVVVADGAVYVRTWQRRTTGWYGRAVAAGSARIQLADQTVNVRVAPSGSADADAVDAAYRAKYGDAGAQSMVTPDAQASTLRLAPASAAPKEPRRTGM